MGVNPENELTIKATVTKAMLADSVGSGNLRVLATPAVAAIMENAACQLAQKHLDDIYTTVGTEISIFHTSPTPVNSEITVSAVLEKTEGREFYFLLTACDGRGVIARGTHTRVSVKKESFQRKADEKFD